VPRFPVPKGADDIRVVWDLAKNGLNEHMFTPSFFLPTMNTYLRRLPAGAYCGDFDIGEQFHNYILHESEQVYCGVEVPLPVVERLQAEGIQITPPLRWGRLVFGWQSSPYLALRMLTRALEYAVGDLLDLGNAFGCIRLERRRVEPAGRPGIRSREATSNESAIRRGPGHRNSTLFRRWTNHGLYGGASDRIACNCDPIAWNCDRQFFRTLFKI
jgi:hypothetical protein